MTLHLTHPPPSPDDPEPASCKSEKHSLEAALSGTAHAHRKETPT